MLGNNLVRILHDRQLSAKQAAQFLAKLVALVLDLKLLFIIENVVEYRLDLSCLLFDLLIELFTLRTFLNIYTASTIPSDLILTIMASLPIRLK